MNPILSHIAVPCVVIEWKDEGLRSDCRTFPSHRLARLPLPRLSLVNHIGGEILASSSCRFARLTQKAARVARSQQRDLLGR